MINKYILPKKESFIRTYPKDANAISILLNYERSYAWLMNSFIQLTSYDDLYLDYYDFYYRNCPLIDYQRIKRDVIGNDVIGFIVNALYSGYYISLAVNTKFIKAYQSNNDRTHDMFIYGYDKDEELFYISDCFVEGKYSDSICSFKELIEAVENNTDYWFEGYRDSLELLSYCEEERAELEIYRIKESINDYLMSRPTQCWYENDGMWNQNEKRKRTFGVDCYRTIWRHLEIAREYEGFSEGGQQAFYLMFEHKKVMLERLKYLNEKKSWISMSAVQEYEEKIVKEVQKSMMMKLKFDVSGRKHILQEIEKRYHKVIEEEIKVLNSIEKRM